MTHHASVATPALPEDPNKIRQELRESLLALSYHGYLHCLRRLLLRMGYSEVQTLGRTLQKGHNEDGGADLSAHIETGLLSHRVIVQAKHWADHSVQKRCVDELRGVLLRTGAKQGILITTSTFSDVARSAARAGDIAPVRLVDGDELLTLLTDYSVGIQHRSDGDTFIDHEFFDGLNRNYPPATARGIVSDTKPESARSVTELACHLPIHIQVTVGKERE